MDAGDRLWVRVVPVIVGQQDIVGRQIGFDYGWLWADKPLGRAIVGKVGIDEYDGPLCVLKCIGILFEPMDA
jgi:hypothetical protein